MKKCLIILIILLLSISIAEAVTITINSDRTINIDGNKTFMTGMVAICTESFQGVNPKPDCVADLNVNNNSIFDPMPNGQNSNNYTYSKASKFDVHNMYYGMRGWESRNTTVEALPGFWGYMQVDEPTIDDDTATYYSIGYTQAEMLASLTAKYNDKKYSVTGHPMWLNICCKGPTGSGFNLVGAQQYADIVSFDKYGFANFSWDDWDFVDGNYVWETYLAQDVLPSVTTDFEDADFTKPVWSYVQAFGVVRTIGGPTTINKTIARSVTWMQITSGIDGILYYAWLTEGDWYNASTSKGMWRNQTLGEQYNDLIGEVRSMNDILVSPMISHQWFQHQDTDVTFNTTINKVVHYQNVNNWNWMRKELNGKTYLVVVNKDNAAVSNVKITISNLSGAMSAKMLGDETTGSASEHKVTPLTVTNGVFTDSFDGYAVHIYEITDNEINDTIPGTPTQISSTQGASWINTSWVAAYSGASTNSFNVSINGAWTNGTYILFKNTTGLSSGQWQNVTVWAWNSTGAGNLSSSAATLNTQISTESTESSQGYWFNETGTYNVTVYGTNADGTTQVITWIVTVEDEPEPPIESWSGGIGGQYFQNQTIGQNNTCINQGDGAIGICSPDTTTDNFDDNNKDGWNISTITGVTYYNITNGALNLSGISWSYLNQNVPSYENKSIFAEITQYGNLNSTIDASDLRGNLSRETDASTKMAQFSLAAGVNRTNISIGDAWTMIAIGTKPMFVGQKLYTVFMVNGTTYRAYISNVSTADALANSLLTGTDSTWLNGTTIQFGGGFNSNSIVSWDNIRTVNLDAQGNQYLQGNYSMNYTDMGGLYIRNITINSTLPSGTNYSVEYRQNATGNYIAVGGVQTSISVTLELPNPYYNAIDLRLNLNATISDTPWINTITIGNSTTTINLYNTGYQYVLVNNSLTNSQLNSIWGPTWIIGWNSTSQKWENYKSGWNIRASRSSNKGDAIGIKIFTNKSVNLTYNTTYNWTLKPGQNLIGLERTKTLSQINTSIGTCNADKIEYIDLDTQISYLFTCGQAGNASIIVNKGEGVFINSTANIDTVRSW